MSINKKRTPLWRSGGPIMGRKYIYPPPPVRNLLVTTALTLFGPIVALVLMVLYFVGEFRP